MDTLITLKEITMKTYRNPWTVRCLLLRWGCLLALAAHAHGFAVGELFVRHPYTVPSLAGSPNGAVYFKGIKNAGKEADQLVSAKTPVADAEVSMVKGNPNGYHLMLLGLKQPLKDGDRFPVWLTFKQAGEVKVEVYVQPPKAAAQTEKHQH